MTHETGVMKKACFLMLVCVLALTVASAPNALCYPPAGSDYMERTTATIELQIYGPSGFYETIVAKGPTAVSRSDPYVPGDGHIKIDTEIVYMNLAGISSRVGPITVIESPSKASTGQIRQKSAGIDFPADSFFGVYIEIKTSLPFPLGTLHNDDPKNMTAVITSIPPFGSVYESPVTVYLKDELDNIVGAMLATRHEVEPSVPGTIHDVGIPNVAPSKNIIGQGYNASVNAMLFNYGNDTETFNVTFYANQTIIGEIYNIDLTSRNFTTLTLGWNTAGFAKGKYTISAYAEPVPGEIDTTDNNCTGGTVTVTIAGDVTGEGLCDMQDISIIIDWFMASHPKYYANCDVNNDLTIDMLDISIAIDHFMQS